ncbi:MAG: diaminopimelate decarboxylase family protein [Akkermansia sp.]
MHSFAYKNGTLYCENVNLQELADKESTPLYVYSKQTILNHFHRLREALAPLNAEVAYAVKASSNIAILNLMARNGAGFDIVSGGELFRVLKAGGDPSKCTYAGVGKTEAEIRYALEQGIYCFNVESETELRAINAIAASMGVKAPVAVRVNPNVEAGTHKYITTGKAENKLAWTSNALNLFMRWRPANF